MCKKCGNKKCQGSCQKTVYSRKGVQGPRGPRGLPGPPGPSGGDGFSVVGQSAFWAGISGPVAQDPSHTIFNNLESNFFNPVSKFYVISIGLSITAGSQHTVTAFFRKNGVQVGQTYVKTMFPTDHLIFSTDLIQFVNGDLLDLWIKSTAADCQVQPFHLIHYKQ